MNDERHKVKNILLNSVSVVQSHFSYRWANNTQFLFSSRPIQQHQELLHGCNAVFILTRNGVVKDFVFVKD